MSELTDTQRSILAAAIERPGRRVLPLPERIKGGAAKKAVDALLTRGLVEEAIAYDGEPVVRDGVALVATDAAFTALGTNAEQPCESAAPFEEIDAAQRAISKARPNLRAGTKQAQLIAMLETADGATIAEIAKVLSWQPHTVRGAIAGALKTRLGLTIGSQKVEGRGRVYRITR